MAAIPSNSLYGQRVQRLRRLCRSSGLVPTSCKIPKDVTLLSPMPVSQSHFSDIYRGKLDQRDVAIKVLRLHMDEIQTIQKVRIGLQAFAWNRIDFKQAYLHELVLWQCLRHPNIVPFIGTSQAFQVSLVSEWMVGGTISAFLQHNPEFNRVPYVRGFAGQTQLSSQLNISCVSYQVDDVICGLTFMHSLDVVHGDMKAVSL
jgi:serine/threonine protein kinase